MSILQNNIFLLLIAIFSFYLALAGWSYAKNRLGTPKTSDWTRAYSMLAAASTMAVYGIFLMEKSGSNAIIMLVFAGVAFALSINDLLINRSGGVTGHERIAKHLTMMLAGTIATITAFLVVNISFSPAFVVWLAPTAVITPIIIAMASKIRRNGMKQAKGKIGA